MNLRVAIPQEEHARIPLALIGYYLAFMPQSFIIVINRIG